MFLPAESVGAWLTPIYQRFHSPTEKSPDIAELRTLHIEMDHAVAHAYGWADLALDHGFHETRQGKRFTISEHARQEVLQRLLLLNHERAREEELSGVAAEKSGAGKSKGGKRKKQEDTMTMSLFSL